MAKVLGRYHIISELGRGGMGVVYKAVDPKLERFIAIKCLSDELSEDEITVTRFLREARNVAALNHPHIAQIFLADEDEGRPYFVMEFIDGESLAERLARDKRLMPEHARRIIIAAAEALKPAHEENIVHRDIKPGNIMIDRRGRAILTDFGIASIVHPDQQPKVSKYIMGTPGYLPPEVMTGQPADHRGDIFALGAVYYEMLTGRRLVPGRDIEDTARTLLASDFPVLADLDEQIDEVTFGVLGRMLAQDPAKRYQDYDSLLADLKQESASPAAAAVRQAAPPTGDEPTRLAESGRVLASASAEMPPTEAVNPGATAPPATASSAPPSPRRGGGLGLFFGLAAALFLLGGAAVASLVILMPERFEPVTALFSATSAPEGEAPEQAASESPAPEPFPAADLELVDRIAMRPSAEEAAQAPDDHQAEDIGDGGHWSSDESAAAALAEAEAELEPPLSAASALLADEPGQTAERASTVPPTASPADAPLVVAEPRTEEMDQSLAMVRTPERPARRIEPEVERRPAPPGGVLVLGMGDPVFVDPVVREIEEALRADGHDIVERGFVAGLSRLLADSELDLSALSRAAIDAGAGFAVVARAMPAGQRQLHYHGRTDTAYTVQFETVTYDLAARRRIDASELEQIEYTALSATRLARESIARQLPRISAHLDH
ncbi:MAG: protein kinase [Wenzhouxiangella sp.]|nr:protein kinase [Wenzhouxiangella sp.]